MWTSLDVKLRARTNFSFGITRLIEGYPPYPYPSPRLPVGSYKLWLTDFCRFKHRLSDFHPRMDPSNMTCEEWVLNRSSVRAGVQAPGLRQPANTPALASPARTVLRRPFMTVWSDALLAGQSVGVDETNWVLGGGANLRLRVIVNGGGGAPRHPLAVPDLG